MTEAQRYEGGRWDAANNTGGKKKKRNPQEEWMDIVVSCIETCPGNLKNYMQTMASLDNIPRKQKQFRNFTANSLRLKGSHGDSIVGELWNVLQAEREKRLAAKKQEEEQEKAKKEAQQQAKEKEAKKKSAQKDDDDSSSSSSSSSEEEKEPEIDPKQVNKQMKKALKKAPNKVMKIKDMRKVIGKKLKIPKSAEKKLKELIKNAPQLSKSKIVVDGKLLKLQ